MILLGKAQGRLGRRHLLVRLLNHGGLQDQLGVDRADLAFRGLPVGDRLTQSGLEIPVVYGSEHLTRLDRLIVGDQHLGDVAGDARGDQGIVRLHIRVVGGNQEAPGLPILRPVMRRCGQA